MKTINKQNMNSENEPVSRQTVVSGKRWVIKIGSALLTNNGQGLDENLISHLVENILDLLSQGKEVVLVSSGAVAAGVSKLGLKGRPKKIHQLQAAAAVGQMSLVQAYETRFKQANKHTAQILLTHEDLSNRKRYLNARSTLLALIDLGVVPVINENDTVVTDEIRFGDNDNLAALVANLIQANVMVILTNQNGMYDQDPNDNPQATLLDNLSADDPTLKSMASGSKDGLGRGGMITKVQSASLAARSGACTIIANGAEDHILGRLANGEVLGTLLFAKNDLESARKQWLASHLQMSGELVLDAGAVKVLQNNNSSLLAVGVIEVQGKFARGDMVCCVDQSGKAIARGLVNYSSNHTRKILGQASDAIEQALGFVDEPELINRDNLVLVS
jgi:glutamate 5-kinase